MFGEEKKEDLIDKLLHYPLFRLLFGLAMGLGFGIWGGVTYHKATVLTTHGIEVQGKVLSVKKIQKKRGASYYPTVEFADAEGNIHQVETSDNDNLPVGEEVDVIYLPSNPKMADIKGASALSPGFSYVLFGLAAIGWAAVAYNIYFMIRYKQIIS